MKKPILMALFESEEAVKDMSEKLNKAYSYICQIEDHGFEECCCGSVMHCSQGYCKSAVKHANKEMGETVTEFRMKSEGINK